MIKKKQQKGPQCQQAVEWCTSLETNPCLNGAKCLKQPPNSYVCECAPGYEGANCTANADDCINHKCQFGVCVDGIGNYTCRCKDGFSGLYCDIMVPIALPLQQQQPQPLSIPTFPISANKPVVVVGQKQQQFNETPTTLTHQCSGDINNHCLNGGLCQTDGT